MVALVKQKNSFQVTRNNYLKKIRVFIINMLTKDKIIDECIEVLNRKEVKHEFKKIKLAKVNPTK